MNIKQANNLDFKDLLSKLGHEPVVRKKEGTDLWYYSPFRKETTPSFHIRVGNIYSWVWHDFGHEGACTILDFIMQYKNFDKKAALAFLDQLYPKFAQRSNKDNLTYRHKIIPPTVNLETFREFEFIRDLPLHSELILSYLEKRKIPRKIAIQYFRLIQYQYTKKPSIKPYFGFGMRNKSGGWEVRSASNSSKFKTALIVKDISLIPGSAPKTNTINIFEGQTDFVSLLAMLNCQQLRGDSIILNSLTLNNRAISIIKEEGYRCINTFLDNNKAGVEITKKIVAKFGIIVHNQSTLFLPYTDLNEALIANHIPRF